MNILDYIFIFSLLLLGYTFFGYPLLLTVLSRLFPRPVRRGGSLPRVTVIIPAYNEAEIIGRKLRNTLALDYPRDRLEIVVASDGSADGTVLKARRFEGAGVRVVAFGKRRGKIALFNDVLPSAKGEVILFTDASGMIEPQALRRMVENFDDPDVGGVCGIYMFGFDDRTPRGRGERSYWNYEFRVKEAASRLGTILGATGALYAIRKELYVSLSPGLINDDFLIPAAVAARGFRVVLDKRAVVVDSDADFGSFARRVRVAAGNWQQIFAMRRLFSPRYSLVFWQFLSHKVFRALLPFFALIAVVIPFIGQASFYSFFRIALLAFLCLAVLGGLLGRKRVLPRFAVMPYYICSGLLAGLVGSVKFALAGGKVSWS
ncbi:MAG: glycosyltransferase family 2 protein [Candidatus Tritonobacter lacicola]|nr:glycosyltransferase family 2 protein [Candidatus Tritonobacter lacicola]